jgi:hypothetical protein
MDPSLFEPQQPPSFTIHISGLAPTPAEADPLAIDPFPHVPGLYRDLLYLKRCYDLGIEDPNLDQMEVKGHG